MSQNPDEEKRLTEQKDNHSGNTAPSHPAVIQMAESLFEMGTEIENFVKFNPDNLQQHRREAARVFAEYTSTIIALQIDIKSMFKEYKDVKLKAIDINKTTSDKIKRIVNDCQDVMIQYTKDISNNPTSSKVILATRQIGLNWNASLNNENVAVDPQDGCCVIL